MEVSEDRRFFSAHLLFLLLRYVDFFLNIFKVLLFFSDVLLNLIGPGSPKPGRPKGEYPPHQETYDPSPYPSSIQRLFHLYFKTLIEATKLPKKPRTIPPNNIQMRV